MTPTLIGAPDPNEGPRSTSNPADYDARAALYARSHKAAVTRVAATLPAIGTAFHATLSAFTKEP